MLSELSLLQYFLHSSGILALMLVVYRVCLYRSTSFNLRRAYLLAALIISLLLPLLTFTTITTEVVELATQELSLDTLSRKRQPATTTSIVAPMDWRAYAVYAYFYVGALGLVYVLLQLVRIWRSIASSELQRRAGFTHVIRTLATQPHSFFKFIIYDTQLHNDPDQEFILNHEEAHARDWHTLDQLIASVYLIAFWANPAAWLLRRYIIENHEHIADRAAIQATRSDRQNYAQALLSHVITNPSNGLAPAFASPSIKTRIKMIYRKPTPRLRNALALVCLPLLSLFVYGFQTSEVTRYEYVTADPAAPQQSAERIDYVSVRYDKNSTLEELQKDQKWLKEEKNIDLVYSNVNFNNGVMTSLTIAVDCNDGFNGTASTSNDDGINPIGFWRDYKPDSQSPFGIGNPAGETGAVTYGLDIDRSIDLSGSQIGGGDTDNAERVHRGDTFDMYWDSSNGPMTEQDKQAYKDALQKREETGILDMPDGFFIKLTGEVAHDLRELQERMPYIGGSSDSLRQKFFVLADEFQIDEDVMMDLEDLQSRFAQFEMDPKFADSLSNIALRFQREMENLEIDGVRLDSLLNNIERTATIYFTNPGDSIGFSQFGRVQGTQAERMEALRERMDAKREQREERFEQIRAEAEERRAELAERRAEKKTNRLKSNRERANREAHRADRERHRAARNGEHVAGVHIDPDTGAALSMSVTIMPDTTDEELEGIEELLESKGSTVKIRKVRRNKRGLITRIMVDIEKDGDKQQIIKSGTTPIDPFRLHVL